MISYDNFLELLENKNILLWDFQKRISYNRLSKITTQQYGGGAFNKIENLDNFKLNNIILYLLQNNIDSAKKLLN
jgi:hypothetical protein